MLTATPTFTQGTGRKLFLTGARDESSSKLLYYQEHKASNLFQFRKCSLFHFYLIQYSTLVEPPFNAFLTSSTSINDNTLQIMRGCTVQGNLQQVYEVTNLNHHVFKEVRIKIKIKTTFTY